MELILAFERYEAFEEYLDGEGRILNMRLPKVIAEVEAAGVTEPLTHRHFAPEEMRIDPTRAHVSLWAGKFNCRMRAGMLALEHAISALPAERRKAPKILGAEGLTDLARVLSGLFTYYLSTEFLPTEEERARHYPIQHLDLMDIRQPDEAFDLFYSAHVLEHVPDVHESIGQIARVLRPGGVLVSTFPFRSSRKETITKARLTKAGEIEHLTEPEYHGNPVHPGDGSLVFQLPGWDILDTCRAAGLTEAKLVQFTSTRHGVVGAGEIGSFALMARKPAPGERPGRNLIRQLREL